MIEPRLYREPLPGKTRSHVVHFSDGKDYVVKFYRKGFERVLPNEWIGYCLARFLGLPVPYSQLVQIPEAYMTDVWKAADVVYTSDQFATLFLPNTMNLRQLSESGTEVNAVVNSESLAGIIVLDYWLDNRDRNRNNLLAAPAGPESHRFWMIDQGDLFGASNWSADQMQKPQMELYPSATHKWMAQFIQAEDAFEKYLRMIHSIPKLLIEEILALIPDDWGVADEDKKVTIDWLVYRRDRQLQPIIRRFIKTVYRSSETFHI